MNSLGYSYAIDSAGKIRERLKNDVWEPTAAMDLDGVQRTPRAIGPFDSGAGRGGEENVVEVYRTYSREIDDFLKHARPSIRPQLKQRKEQERDLFAAAG